MTHISAAPDEAPAPSTKTLPFIPDAADRTGLQNDIAGVERAIQNGEWKAATVLAGSVIEALLLWALSQDAKSALGAATAPKGKTDLGRWDLVELIKVAAELKIVGDQTVKRPILRAIIAT